MSHNDYLTFEEFNRRSATPQTHTTPAALGIAVLAGIAALFKFLDFLGYPVWFWIRQFAHNMALELVRAVSPTPSLDSVASDNSTQSGGMMGNLFGRGASALSKGVRGVASALSRGPSDAPPGLGNFDNSCYQNSVIQGLASLPSLRDYLETTTAEHKAFTNATTNGALLEMSSQLNDPQKHGQHFWVRGKLKSMSTFTQQDAQEYYSRILDELDKEVKKATNSDREEDKGVEKVIAEKSDAPTEQAKSIPIPLEGSLAQRVGCTTCGYSEGLSLIPFNCITVSLGRNRSGYDIRELLDEHTNLEYIEGVECSKCTLLKLKSTLAPLAAAKGPESPFATRLQAVQEALDDEDLKDTTLTKTFNIPKKNWVKSEKSKQVVVARAPKSLVLHINRSIFDETTFAQYKNNAGVAYPSTLDLGKWCLGAQPSGSQKPDLDPKTEEWPRDPRESMLAGADDGEPSPFQYKLRAAVTHFGTHGNGHYVCYRPHPKVARKAPVEAKDETEDEEEEKDVEESGVQKEDAEDAEDAEETVGEQKQPPEDESQVEDAEVGEAEDEEEQPAPHEEQWWRFSDDTVYAVSEREAHQGNVFMLFYERIDSSSSNPPTLPPTLSATETAPLPSTLSPTETAPLPPTSTPTPEATTSEAVAAPIPSPDKTTDFIPPAATASQPAPPVPTSADPEPADPSDADPDPESEAESAAAPPTSSVPQLSPHTMRTAGASARGQGSRASLPLVSAT